MTVDGELDQIFGRLKEAMHHGGPLDFDAASTGKIKWFDCEKGYGFILPDEGDDEIFVHRSAFPLKADLKIAPGQRVEFEVVEGDKGKRAVKARIALVPPDGVDWVNED